MNIPNLKKKETYQNLVSAENTISSLLQLIPVIGGSLNQLVFGRMQEIRISNIEASISALTENFKNISGESVDNKWITSNEFLQIFKEFIEKIELESDSEKIKILSDIFTKFTLTTYSKEENKLMILLIVSQLTSFQIKLFKTFSEITPKTSSFDISPAFKYNGTFVHIDEINQKIKELNLGTHTYNLQFEILKQIGLIDVQYKKAYSLTNLGILISAYL